ncbi:MAG TPA: hypothetical protein VEX88_01645 [Glaciibacter sp.]|nr:hypothetical protein [Glaciibacter sp.]
MIAIDATSIHSGVILPQSVLQADLFAVFAAFVAINTVIYVVLAVLKILPRPHITDLLQWRNRRGETRSIYPHEPVTGAATEASAVPDPLPGSVGGR